MMKRICLCLAALLVVIAATPLTAAQSIDANGRAIELADLPFLEGAGGLTVCFNMVEAGIDWNWELEVVTGGGMATVTGGNISGTICDSPNWSVTGGNINPTSIDLSGVYDGVESCADNVDLIGDRNGGGFTWTGTYGFFGANDSFPQSISFVGVGACP